MAGIWDPDAPDETEWSEGDQIYLSNREEEFFDGIFISDEIGYEKPQIEFFNYVFDRIPTKNPDEVIIIGDSLTSDIAGGIRAGIHTCWYHPSDEENYSDVKPEFTITSHPAFQELLKQL